MLNEPFFFQDASDGYLNLGTRHQNLMMSGYIRIPDASQHIGNRIGHGHG
jgi:hypothetical protein